MGLDTTHNCWHGSYGAFHRWRSRLWDLLTNRNGPALDEMEGYGPPYHSMSRLNGHPLKILFEHSDCDGEIHASDCGPLADELEKLLPGMEQRALYDALRPATERFIKGLRLAASLGENVEFM
jgi:hypothetical protein